MIIHFKSKAFTLIELLIVVAIIAILAAIAVPNFLEAQTRSKVSRCKADMRSLATALEAYTTDWNNYPLDASWYAWNESTTPQELWNVRALSALTTPVSFMTSIPRNPFPNKTDEPGRVDAYFRYFSWYWKELILFGNPTYPNTSKVWSLASCGPNQISNVGEYYVFGMEILESIPGNYPEYGDGCLYDPTNGTVSEGDIVRIGP